MPTILGDACVFALENWTALDKKALRDDHGKILSLSKRRYRYRPEHPRVIHQVADAVGYKGKIEWDTSKPDGTSKKQLNVSRLSEMGWRAKIELTAGLKMAYNDFLED